MHWIQTTVAAPASQNMRKPARSEEIRRKLQRARRNDTLGRYAITTAGVMVLVSVGTILVFLVVNPFH